VKPTPRRTSAGRTQIAGLPDSNPGELQSEGPYEATVHERVAPEEPPEVARQEPP